MTVERFAAAWLLAVTAPAFALETDTVAMIQAYSGEPEQYRVVRKSETLGVMALMELRAGDEVVIGSATGELTVVYYGGAPVVVHAGSSPHVVVDSRSERSVAGNLLRWATGLVGRWRAEDDEPQLESMISRGEAAAAIPRLDIPLLSSAGSIVRAGKRDVYLAWTGGLPPYEVTLRRVSSKAGAVATVKGLDEARTVLEHFALDKGVYEIVIVDASAASVRGRFEARRKIELPALPAGALVGTTSPAYEATLSALYLSAQGDREFAFESYQRLSAHVADYPPAKTVARTLERGERISPP